MSGALVAMLRPDFVPRYLRLGGPPGFIHRKIIATSLKNQRFSQQKLMLTSGTKILNKIKEKQKGKACQNKLNSFSTEEKRQKIDENLVEEVQ